MRIFKATELLLLLFFVVCLATSAPVDSSQNSTIPAEPSPLGDHYDQRQNGTENYRIHVDGVVVVVAPVEALLLAGGLPGGAGSDILDISQQADAGQKPKPEKEEEATIEPISKPDVETVAAKPDGKSSHRCVPTINSSLLHLNFYSQVHYYYFTVLLIFHYMIALLLCYYYYRCCYL